MPKYSVTLPLTSVTCVADRGVGKVVDEPMKTKMPSEAPGVVSSRVVAAGLQVEAVGRLSGAGAVAALVYAAVTTP